MSHKDLCIGIAVDSIEPQAGGAFTFQKNLYSFIQIEFQKYNIPTKLIINGNFSNYFDINDLEVVNLSKRFYLISRVLKVFFFTLKRNGWRNLSVKNISDQLKRQFLIDNGINYLINLNQNTSCYSLPYLVINWDVEHIRKPWTPEYSEFINWSAREIRFAEILKRAHIVITGTEIGKNDLIKFYNLDNFKIGIIPLPFEPRMLEISKIENSYNLPVDVFFYPAGYWPHKNHRIIIESVKKLVEEKTDLPKILFIGADKGNLSQIKHLINDYNLSDSFEFFDFLSLDDLLKIFRKNAVLLYPSTFGPDNLPPLDAIIARKIAIVSDTAGHREQLGDMALYCPPHDVDSWVDAIRNCVQNTVDENPKYESERSQLAHTRSVQVYAAKLVRIVMDSQEQFIR